MNRTIAISMSLRRMYDNDGGYECVVTRHYQNRDMCSRRYFPARASRKRLKKMGVTCYKSVIDVRSVVNFRP